MTKKIISFLVPSMEFFKAELFYSSLHSTSKTPSSLCFRTLKAKIRSTDAGYILLVGWLVGFVDGEMKCITFRTRVCN